jgi:glycine betaine/proline transport system permease protein
MTAASGNHDAAPAVSRMATVAVGETLDLSDSIQRFAGRNGAYYVREFNKIQSTSRFSLSFNWGSALAGPVWAGARGLWGLFCCLAILELLMLVPLGQGLWSDLGAEERTRVEKLEHNYERMLNKAKKAKDKGKTARAAKLQKNADNLNNAMTKAQLRAQKAENTATVLIIAGLIGLLLVKLFEGAWANIIYEKHYSRWRTNRGAKSGLNWTAAVIALILVTTVYATTLYRFTATVPPEFLVDFPVEKATYQEPATRWIDTKFDAATIKFGDFFQRIAKGIRIVLEALETMLVDTPWPVVMSVIVITAWRLAGPRVAIFTLAALAYLAVLGYWEKSMSTVALLGTAALICILVGVPLGVWFSRSDRAYSVGRPVLDFMQSMPAFVYLIPVIAFFGTGKPPGVIASIVFGLPPIVRLTNLGLRQVPLDIKEAAEAFGATKWKILTGVEIPLALPSIMTGINQTILFCLSAVVIAALIGAKGLGFDVLVALQYAAKGQGVLAGLAILFCAMVIDRIVQGSFRQAHDTRSKSP